MTSPLPGTSPPSPGSLTPGEPAREPEWQVCLRQLSALHEADRLTAARALHDQIGQAVSAIKMSAHLTLDEADAAQRREDLLEIVRIADDTVAQLRHLHALLHPPQLDGLGLEAALRAEAERFSTTPPTRMTLEIAALPRRPAAEIELTCFRIARQLLRQAAAASPQARIFLRLHGEADHLRLRLEFDDRAFNPSAADRAGSDAPLLRAWATALHGDLSTFLLPEAGVRFELRLPYSLPDASAKTAASTHAPPFESPFDPHVADPH